MAADLQTSNAGARAVGASSEEEHLRSYNKAKLEIAEIIRSTMDLARGRREPEAAGRGQQLLARLAEDRFNLAVVGKFNRGKSTLMNAVLGRECLPVGVLPQTSVITTVCHGSRERLLIRRKGWSLPQELPISDMWKYVSEKGNPANQEEVALAEVQLPDEILRQGFYFIDTPGVGSIITANTRTTEAFLPEADAVIFVTSFESPLGEDELDLLRAVQRHVRKIFVVVNKRDLVSREEQHEVLDFIRGRLETELSGISLELFAISAREGLAGKLAGTRELLARSGLTEFEQALVRFLTREKAQEFLFRIVDRSARLLDDLQREMSLEVRASQDPDGTAARRKQFTESVERLRGAHREISENLGRKATRELAGRLEQPLVILCAEIRGLVTTEIESWLSNKGLLRASPWPQLDAKLRDACTSRVKAWLSERSSDFNSLMREMLGDDLERLRRLHDEVSRTCFELFDLHPSDTPDACSRDDVREPGSAYFADPPDFLWSARPRLWFYISPVSWSRNFLVRQWSESLDGALREYRGAIFQLVIDAGSAWIDRLSRDELEKINASAARMEELTDGQASRDQSSAMEDLRIRLDAIRMNLGAGEPTGLALPVSVGTDQEKRIHSMESVKPCPICIRVVESLLDFMRRYQYELAVSEAAQAQHADTRGFCPLHTWQYERMASPQGICAGYPRVLSRLAERLRSAALSEGADCSSEDVRRLLAGPNTCPACQVVEVAEREAEERLLSQLNSPADADSAGSPPLCLPHLYRVLSAMPAGDDRQILLHRHAQILDRVAEDMQQHALKHYAIRRGLMTEEESNAHIHGLSLLAGHPGLSAMRRR
jgi:small GTP-binding protein